MSLINREALLAEYDRVHVGKPGNARKLIEDAPTIEPERKKGKWIPQDHNKITGITSTSVFYYPKCSECGHSGNYTNFCPRCGADMREDTDDQSK